MGPSQWFPAVACDLAKNEEYGDDSKTAEIGPDTAKQTALPVVNLSPPRFELPEITGLSMVHSRTVFSIGWKNPQLIRVLTRPRLGILHREESGLESAFYCLGSTSDTRLIVCSESAPVSKFLVEIAWWFSIENICAETEEFDKVADFGYRLFPSRGPL